MRRRPFRDPHHSASLPALVGGGSRARPGEISLAHAGVLFLDELPEFPRATLESLRQPLETARAVVSRANHHVTYPARVQLVAAIAASLGRHRSTIHREISRNFYHMAFRDRWGQAYRGYFCVMADGYARTRRSRPARMTLRPALGHHVIAKLRDGWSPQHIAGRLKCEALPCGTISP